ncbi:MAG: outer membrane beta-barrel protein [Polaribacter sp.]|nr:outer membrane beta-barrel protein [Polaribacter sp.]MDG1954168.1 outer membrane beta-barrel protein [Polaribacter sp.]MDG2073232.1 outer membrane beta-barrel protein [Polaribacter sp.]
MILAAILVVTSLSSVKAQKIKYAVTAGYHNLTLKVSAGGFAASGGETGFYLGVSAEFQVAEKLSILPELQYANSADNTLVIPIMAKYYVSEKFNLQAGPQLDLFLSAPAGFNSLGFGLGFGGGYDFSEKIYVTTRYSLGLSNRVENAPAGASIKFDTFQIGVGYRF